MTRFSSGSTSRLMRIATVLLALAVAVPLGSTAADARLGGGFSFGSRGTRTFSAPPTTMTAPRPAMPMQRTETPNFGTQAPGLGMQPRRFGFGSGLAAGLLGAGLFGMLTGNGFFGGIGSLFSLVGLLLQIGLIVLVIRFALAWFRNRNGAPAYAAPAGAAEPTARTSLGGLGGFGGQRGARPEPLAITPDDYAAFERLLSDLQYAYSREDMTALSRLATPEMVRHLQADLAGNRQRGVRNDLSDVRMLQGDLAEAWRENGVGYATVAMRFSARDVMLDRASGRVVGGDPNHAVEATEVWTFQRDSAGLWRLSAVQQTG